MTDSKLLSALVMDDFYIYADDYDYDDTLGPGTELQLRIFDNFW